MKNITKRGLSLLCTVALLLSMVLPGFRASAVTVDNGHQVFDTMYQGEILADFDTGDFSLPYGAAYGDTVVEDADAYGGHAAKLSYADRVDGTGGTAMAGHMIISEKLEITSTAYDADYDGLLVTKFTPAELNANAGAGYVLYKAEDVRVMAHPKNDGNELQMFACTGFRIDLDDYTDVLGGQTVDLYLSMKITGDVTNTTDNTPAYYIDRVVITKADPKTIIHGEECVFGNYEYKADAKKNYLSVADLIANAEEGDILASFGTSSFELPNAAYGDAVVSDSGAWNGSAAKFSYAARVTGGMDSNGLNSLLFTDDEKFELLTDAYDSSTCDGLSLIQIYPDTLQSNSSAGYVLYKADNVRAWANTEAESNYLRMLGWALNINVTNYKDVLAGATVDVYLSMKIEGTVNGTDTTAYPTYFIDGVIITKSNAFEPDMDLGTLVGKCVYGCGATDVKPASAGHVQVFDADDFGLADNLATDTKPYDPDSVMGTVVKRELSVQTSVPMAAYPVNEGSHVIGELQSAGIIVNSGYQVYRFSSDSLPDLQTASVLYMFNDWRMQSTTLLNALKASSGKAIDIYLSMKVVAVDSEHYDYYIDRVMLVERCSFDGYTSDNNATCVADGTKWHTCSVCGLKEHALDIGSATGNHTFTAENHDDDYLKVGATCYSQAEYYRSCSVCGLSSKGQTGEDTFKYGTTTDHTYTTKASDQLAEGPTCDEPAKYYVQCDYCTAVSNTKTVYVGESKQHTMGQWEDMEDGEHHKRVCQDCDTPQVRAHSWDNGDITKKPSLTETGETKYTCTVCGATKKETLDKTSALDIFDTMSNEEILAEFDYHDFVLPYSGSAGDAIVSDPEAPCGFAAMLAYAARADSGDDGLINAMIRTEGQKLEMVLSAPAPGTSVTVGSISDTELRTNADQGYQLYKFDNVTPLPTAGDGRNFLYMFDCWGFQINLNDYVDVLEGETVDVYVYLKVTGDIANAPAYYIERVVITKADPKMLVHGEDCVFGDYVYRGDATDTSVGAMIGSCIYKCGKTHMIPADADHIKVFTAEDFYFAGDGVTSPLPGDSKVEDPDSVMDLVLKRESYVGGQIRNNMILQESNNLDFGTQKDTIGTITAAEIKTNQGYQLYKFSFENAAFDDEASIVYLFSDWQLQSTTMMEALEACTGKNIDIYLSMKVEGVVDGTDPEHYPVYYIDKVMIVERCSFNQYTSDNNATCVADGTKSHTCSVCGLKEYALESATGLHTFAAEVAQEQYLKSAASCTQASVYYKSCAVCGLSSKGTTGEATFELDDKKAHSFTNKPSDSIANAGNCNDPALYYVQCDNCTAVSDTLTIVVSTNLAHSFGNWTDDEDGKNHSRVCSVCQLPEVKPHTWNDGVVTKEPTAEAEGEKTYTCTACQATKKEVLSKLPGDDYFDFLEPEDILAKFDYQNFVLPYGAGVGDMVVADSESVTGYAAMLSYAGRAPSNDAGLINAMIRTEGQTLNMYMNTSEIPVGQFTVQQLQANAQAGGYMVYKFDNVTALPEAAENNYLYMFDCWGFQIPVNGIKDVLAGQKVDVYLSLKVTGDVTNTTDNTPAYYIDRVVIAKANPKTPVNGDECVFGNYVYQGDATATSPGTMVGTCIYGCGKTDVKPASTAHVHVFDASSFTLAYGDLFGDKIVADKDSVMGSAVEYSAYNRRNEKDQHLIMSEGKYLIIGTDKEVIAELYPEDLKTDGKYHVYKFSFDSLEISTDASLIYLLNDWGMQNTGLLAALKEYKGKAVDLYVSMKITGNIDGANTSPDSADNWPTYYIDKVMVVGPCSFGDFTEADGVRYHTCSVCGLTEYESVDGGNDDGPVKTGDNTPLILLVATILISFCAVAVMLNKRKEQ